LERDLLSECTPTLPSVNLLGERLLSYAKAYFDRELFTADDGEANESVGRLHLIEMAIRALMAD
jgi:hypothetical protein